ncbi:MAG TPA: hypothetical protein VK939_05995 [Longimicrobiales bacterium]|nr:hypothetical protein [Longimicrobiales bacterium]
MNGNTFSMAGRMTFALAITGFGMLCVAYGDFVSSLQPVPASMPAYRALAIATGLLLLGAGLVILVDRGTGPAARLLIIVFISWIVLLHVPSAFLQPRLLRSPWWIRTFETLAFTGAAVILAARASRPVPARWLRAGRIAYGAALPVFGTLHLIYPASTAGLIPPWYPLPMFWAYFTGIAQIAGGIAIAANVFPRLAPALAGVMYGSWALTLHVPRTWCQAFVPCEFMPEVVGLQGSRPGLTSLFVAVGMCGAAWIVAGGTAAGRVERRDDRVVEGSYATR